MSNNNRVSTTWIEEQGVNHINTYLGRSKLIQTAINKMDKYPLWDGEIIIYSLSNRSNRSIYGRLCVQVKTHLAHNKKKFSRGKDQNYKINPEHLPKYRDDGGVLYFYVEIFEDPTQGILNRIYAGLFLPADLNNLIDKNETHITLKPFTFKEDGPLDTKELEKFFFNAIDNKKLQATTAKFTHDLASPGEYFVPMSSNASGMTEFDLYGKEVYVYKRLEGNLNAVVEKVTIGEVKADINQPVSVSDVVYYDNYTVSRFPEGDVIEIGKSIILEGKQRLLKVNLDKGTFKERYQANQFLKAFSKDRKINIGGKTFTFDSFPSLDDGSFFKNESFFEATLLFLDIFRLDDIDLDQFDQEDFKTLEFLLEIFIGKRDYTSESMHTGVQTVALGQTHLLIWAKENPDLKNGFYLYNYYDPDLQNIIDLTIKYGEDLFNNPCIYALPYPLPLLQAANVNHKLVTKTILNIEVNERYASDLLNYVLRLLLVYDENHDIEALNSAEEILHYISMKIPNKTLVRLNLLQIKKRRCSLDNDDIHELIGYKQQYPDDYDIQAAVAILIDSKAEYDYYLNQMTIEERGHFLEYPISNLMEKETVLTRIQNDSANGGFLVSEPHLNGQ